MDWADMKTCKKKNKNHTHKKNSEGYKSFA